MIAGAYTTHQFHHMEGEDGEALSSAQIIEAFNAEITEEYHDENGEPLGVDNQFEVLVGELEAQHVIANHRPTEPKVFRAIPESEAPDLMHVMEEFNHLIEEAPKELPNSWGALIITDNQDGLKRLDWVISWDSVVIEGGVVQTDDDGNPIFIYEVETDDDGNPILDENGEAVLVLDEEGNPIPVRRIFSDHIFVHENGAYFD